MSTRFPSPRVIDRLTDGWVFTREQVPVTASWKELQAVGDAVSLPHSWNARDGQDGGNDYYRGRCTYARRLPPAPEHGRTWLEIRGANSTAEVYLNGHRLADHHGGYSTFRVDLTEHLTQTNTLMVVVDNTANDAVYPQRADFTFYGGLYREASLIHVAEAHFRLDQYGGPGLVATPALEGTTAHVDLSAAVTGGESVRFTIDGAGTQTVPVTGGVSEARITIPEVRRWHGRRDPHLYTATAELLAGDAVTDSIDLRFGCREFAVDPEDGFLLNGEPYPLRGVSRHQDWEGAGNAVTTEMMATDLDLLVELGATTVRLAHYQHDQHFYDLCDEAGIVVWAEIPQITEFLPNGTDNARTQLTELIVQNRHHPSIVCWGLSNEITVTGNSPQVLDAHRELHELAHELDSKRLTTMAHLFLLETDDPLVTVPDVMSYNLYYGWYVGEVGDNDAWLDQFHATYPQVAVGLAEYGADANIRYQSAQPVRGDYSEQFQARYHEHMLEMIDGRPWLWATHVWNLADFGADGRDEGGAPGRNQKGLVTFDRRVRKDAFYLYKAAWSSDPFVHLCGRRRVDRAEAVTEVTVYSNQPAVTLWCDGRLVGSQTGRRIFRFQVPIEGRHELVARAGEISDAIHVQRVEVDNPDYVLADTRVTNWFDDDLPSPSGYYSIQDTLADIKTAPAGAGLVTRLVADLAATRGEVAQKVEIPASMLTMVDRMSVATLLRQAGNAIPAEQVRELNATLNTIAKEEQ